MKQIRVKLEIAGLVIAWLLASIAFGWFLFSPSIRDIVLWFMGA